MDKSVFRMALTAEMLHPHQNRLFQDKGCIRFTGERVLRMQCHTINNWNYTTQKAQSSKPVLQTCGGGFVLQKHVWLQPAAQGARGG